MTSHFTKMIRKNITSLFLTLPFLCLEQVMDVEQWELRPFQASRWRHVLKAQPFSFQQPGPVPAIPDSQFAASLPPQIECFQGTSDLLTMPDSPSGLQVEDTRHIMQKTTWISMPVLSSPAEFQSKSQSFRKGWASVSSFPPYIACQAWGKTPHISLPFKFPMVPMGHLSPPVHLWATGSSVWWYYTQGQPDKKEDASELCHAFFSLPLQSYRESLVPFSIECMCKTPLCTPNSFPSHRLHLELGVQDYTNQSNTWWAQETKDY